MATLSKPEASEDVRVLHRYVRKLLEGINTLTNMTATWQGEAVGVGKLAIKGDKSELVIVAQQPPGKAGGVQPPTPVVLRSSVNPARHGDTIIFTAAVPMPIVGTITFYIDNAVYAVITVSPFDGTAVAPGISTLESGDHTIIAYYTGNQPPGIAYLTQRVGEKLIPPMGFLIAPNPAGLHSAVEFRADLPAQAIGIVTFYLDGFSLGSVNVVNGIALLLSTSPLMTAGTHATLASYGGDERYEEREVLGVPLVISSTPGVVVEVVSNNNPAATTESITWGAKIYPAPSSPSVFPTGTVQFYIEGTSYGPPATVVPQPGNGYSFAVSNPTPAPNSLSVGENEVSAEYSGDTHYYPSVGEMTQMILVVTDISVDCADDEPIVGVGTHLICHVPVVEGFAPATGNVDFFVDGGYEDSGFLHGANPPEPPGMQLAETDMFSFNSGGDALIRAEYEGDGTYAGVFEEHSIYVFELASEFEFEDWGWNPPSPPPYNTITRGFNFKMRNPSTDRCTPVAIRVTRAAWNSYGAPLFVGGYPAQVWFNASQWTPVPPDQGVAQVEIWISAPTGTWLPIWFQVEMQVLFSDHVADVIYGTGNPLYPWINNGADKIIMTTAITF